MNKMSPSSKLNKAKTLKQFPTSETLYLEQFEQG